MRIGIVNDVRMAAEVLRRIVSGVDGWEVAWIAANGEEAVRLCAESKPDLVLMDLVMPVMNGVEATRRIMQQNPCPILIVTATVTGHSEMVYEALGYGAVDAVATPTLGAGGGAEALVNKIRQVGLLSGAPLEPASPVEPVSPPAEKTGDPPLVAIGASTGGPNAVREILAGLPDDFPAAVVVIQHVDEQFAGGLAGWLDKNCPLPVELARSGTRPERGRVYIAATEGHLSLAAGGRFFYTPEPADLLYRPSVDVFFESLARHWKGPVVGVLLTGMGRDGAAGLLTLRRAGHLTIAQDAATSVVYGMPKAAAEIDAAERVLPIGEIARAIVGALRGRRALKPSAADGAPE